MPIEDRIPSELEEALLAAPAGSESVLIVDDEPLVLRLCCSILERQGYDVQGTVSIDEAIQLGEAAGRNLRLLLSDIIMPKMSGTDLAGRLRQINPEVRVLFMSGFDGRDIPEYESLRRDAALISKPFTPGELLVAVRAALDKAPGL